MTQDEIRTAPDDVLANRLNFLDAGGAADWDGEAEHIDGVLDRRAKGDDAEVYDLGEDLGIEDYLRSDPIWG